MWTGKFGKRAYFTKGRKARTAGLHDRTKTQCRFRPEAVLPGPLDEYEDIVWVKAKAFLTNEASSTVDVLRSQHRRSLEGLVAKERYSDQWDRGMPRMSEKRDPAHEKVWWYDHVNQLCLLSTN